MKATKTTTNKNLNYICEGNNCGTIDTGYGIYSFVLNEAENELKLWDGIGLCLVIILKDKVVTVHYKDEVDLRAALNIL